MINIKKILIVILTKLTSTECKLHTMTTQKTHIYKLEYDTNAYANLFSYLTQTSYFALNHFLVVDSSTTQPHNQVVFSFSSFAQTYLKKITL